MKKVKVIVHREYICYAKDVTMYSMYTGKLKPYSEITESDHKYEWDILMPHGDMFNCIDSTGSVNLQPID